MIKICMLSRDFLPNIGGIASHVYELSRALVQTGHAVHIVNPTYGQARAKTEDLAGIQVHRLYVPGRTRGWRFVQLVKQTRRYLDSLIAQERIQIVHWHTILDGGALATRYLRSAVGRVFTNHTSTYLESMVFPWKRIYLGWLLSHADHVIAPSEELAEKTLRVGHSADHVSFISNGVDPERFNPRNDGRDFRQRLGCSEQDILILCPRRLVPKNGVIYLVQAMPRIRETIPKARLLLVGTALADEKQRIQKQIAATGIQEAVSWGGSVPNHEMPTRYAAADIVVLPSLKEATSIAGLEAMASGKPLVGTRIGGIPTIVQDGITGLLVPPCEPTALAEAIITLAQDQPLRHDMGSKAAELVKRQFTWAAIAEQTMQVYRSVIDSKS